MVNQYNYNYEIIKNKFGEPLTPHKEDSRFRDIKRKVNETIDDLKFRGVSWNSSSHYTKFANI